MIALRKLINYFSKTELILWGSSVFLIVGSYCVFDKSNTITLIASLIGVTSIMECYAKKAVKK